MLFRTQVFSDPEDLQLSEITLNLLCKAHHRLDHGRRQLQGSRDRNALSAVNTLVDDVGTMDWTLTREICAELEQCNYDCEHERVRELAFSVFGSGAETKTTCENVFAWLSDSARRQSSSDKMADETKFMYVQTCPYAQEGGTPMLHPPPGDIRAQSAADVRQYQDLKPFAGHWQQLPFEGVTKAQIKKWRPAGFFAQRRGAAAALFLLKNNSSENGGLDVDALQQVWAGDLALNLKLCLHSHHLSANLL